jgi:hypothetical protein
MDIKELKQALIKNYHLHSPLVLFINKKKNCLGSVEKVVEELFEGIDESFPLDAIVGMKTATTHRQLKEDGWNGWNDMRKGKYDLPALSLLRDAYDYGWYNAYGLVSEDKRHKEMMGMLNNLLKKIKR